MLIIVVSLGLLVSIDSAKEVQKLRGILFPPARSGELLIIVAQFEQRGSLGIDPTSRIVDQLNFELEKTKIKNARIEIAPMITNEKEARRIGKIHNALFILWGWYDDAGFNPIYTITKEGTQPFEKVELPEISTEIKNFNFFIREMFPKQMVYLGVFTIGQVYYWQDEYEKALNAFNVVLGNLYRNSREGSVLIQKDAIILLYFYRGNLHLKMNYPDKAIADYTRVIELDPKYAIAFGNRGLAQKTKGNVKQAIADYSMAIELDTASVPAYINRGNTYQDLDNIKQAIADYTKAIQLDSTCALAYNNRGTAYDNLDSTNQAIADYNRALELDPRYALAYNNRGYVYERKNNPELAIADYNKAIELDPTLLLAHINRGNIFEKNGNHQQAIAAYSDAIDVDSTHFPAYYNRGLAYQNNGDFDQAIIDFTKAIELNSTYAPTYYHRANAYLERNLKNRAIDDYKMYLRHLQDDADRSKIEKLIHEIQQ